MPGNDARGLEISDFTENQKFLPLGGMFYESVNTAEVSCSYYRITLNEDVGKDSCPGSLLGVSAPLPAVPFLCFRTSVWNELRQLNTLNRSDHHILLCDLGHSLCVLKGSIGQGLGTTPMNKEPSLTGKCALPSCGRKLTTLNLMRAIMFTCSNKTSLLHLPSHLSRFQCAEGPALERRHRRL